MDNCNALYLLEYNNAIDREGKTSILWRGISGPWLALWWPVGKVAIYGRRRIGKTALVEHAFKNGRFIKFEGLEGENDAFQKRHFASGLALPLTQLLRLNLLANTIDPRIDFVILFHIRNDMQQDRRPKQRRVQTQLAGLRISPHCSRLFFRKT